MGGLRGGGSTSNLENLSNLRIVSELDGNPTNRTGFEFCAERWLESNKKLNASALPYFYNLVAANATDSKELLQKSTDAMNTIYSELDDKRSWADLISGLSEPHSSIRPK